MSKEKHFFKGTRVKKKKKNCIGIIVQKSCLDSKEWIVNWNGQLRYENQDTLKKC